MYPHKVKVLASGGIDSTVCLRYYKNLSYEVEAIFVDYGHPANPIERVHIHKLCSQYDIPLTILEFRGARINYPGEIRGRNAFLISSALMAEPKYEGLLALGIHDGSPYYDCGPKFYQIMSSLVSDYTKGAVQLNLPLKEMSKPQVVEFSKGLKVPLELTYSCQLGAFPPCGKCLSCLDRIALGLE